MFGASENCGGAPDAADFAPPPFVPTNQRRGRGRPRGSRGRPLHAAASRDAADVADVAPVRGGSVRAVGSGRGRAAAARLVSLAQGVEPLARHVRVAAAPAPPCRGLDDDEDVVDGTDDDDDSAESEGGNSDDVADAPERGEDFAAAFVADAWSKVACEGCDAARAPMPDSPLDSGSARSNAHLGSELPPFSRQEQHGGCIRSHIDAKIGRGCTSTMEFVKLLFTDAIMDKLVVATNKAAEEHPRVKDLARIKKFWKPVTRDTLRLWFAVATYLGVVKVQNRKHAFSKTSLFKQPWIQKHFSLIQFENVLNCLNCCDHWNLSDEEFKRRNAEYCFWQVEELIKECNVNSQLYFRLGHRISIDEACIPWKGRHRARCFNQKKPHKFHFKKLMCNDSKTGYNYNFYYYGGKGERRPPGMSATCWPIVKLLSSTSVSVHNKNHLIAVDNWFTSSSSFAWLAAHGNGISQVLCAIRKTIPPIDFNYPPCGSVKAMFY